MVACWPFSWSLNSSVSGDYSEEECYGYGISTERDNISFVDCEGGYHEKRLLHDLLDPYNILERPVVNESDPLQLSFGLTLMQIIDVVRREERGTILLLLLLGWQSSAPSLLGEYNKRMTVNGFVCTDKLLGNPLFHFHLNNPKEELRSYITLPFRLRGLSLSLSWPGTFSHLFFFFVDADPSSSEKRWKVSHRSVVMGNEVYTSEFEIKPTIFIDFIQC